MDKLIDVPLVSLAFAFLSIAFLFPYLFNGFTRKVSKLPPGPRGLPVLGNLLQMRTNPHQYLYHLSQRYGNLIYLKLGSKGMVVASSPDTATAILKTYDNDLCNRPDAGLAFNIMTYDRSNITMGPDWNHLRKVCHLPMFSAKSLEEWNHIREAQVSEALCILHREEGKAVDIGDLFHSFTLNVIGQMVLQAKIGDKLEASHFRNTVDEFLTLFGGFRIGDFVPWLDWTDFGRSRVAMQKALKGVDDFFTSKLNELEKKKNNNDNPKPLILILQSKANEGCISSANVKGIVLDMLLAGTDTASKTIEWGLTELIRHPHVLKKLQEEIDEVVGREELVKESHLPQLKYLRAVVTETLRLHPPTPLMLPHSSKTDCEVLGFRIPKNSRVVVNLYAVARDPSRWENALKYDPERFVENPVHIVHAKDFGVIPFGGGRRMCPGRNLGLRMVELAVASLAHAFEWSLPCGEDPANIDMSEKFGLSVTKAMPLLAIATPRLPPHVYQ